MKYSEQLKRFLQYDEEYQKSTLRPTLEAVDHHLQEWKNPAYWNKHSSSEGVATPSPIRMIMTRIKHPEKVVEKISHRPIFSQKNLL